jgi:hypothetical protein
MAKTSKPDSKVKSPVNRAGKKQTASTQTGSSKTSKQNILGGSRDKFGVRNFEPGDTQSYLRLRQSLDSFQAVALYYYTSGENTQQRIERADEIKTYLRSFTQQGRANLALDSDCPPGTRACAGGDCVPIYIGCVPTDGED